MYKNNNDESFEFEAQGGGALPQTLPPELRCHLSFKVSQNYSRDTLCHPSQKIFIRRCYKQGILFAGANLGVDQNKMVLFI